MSLECHTRKGTYMVHENNKNAKYEAKKGSMEDSETA
jgi:hypothetical protein